VRQHFLVSASQTTRVKKSTHTILLVDDEEHDLEFMKRALDRIGVFNPVQVVHNGQEAVSYLLGTAPFDDRAKTPFPAVIITDLKMPLMGGLELLRWIHANPRYRVVPTVVLTSSSAQADVDAAFAQGAVGYMVKPVRPDDLQRVVKTIIDYWRLSLVPSARSG